MTNRYIRTDVRTKMARRLRKALTKPELWLWLRLRQRGPGQPIFRNQHAIGSYILDFYCASAKLCVEVDGETHTHDTSRVKDAERDLWLAAQGIYTHRIIARDLLADPDATAVGIWDLAAGRVELLRNAPPTAASGGPPSP